MKVNKEMERRIREEALLWVEKHGKDGRWWEVWPNSGDYVDFAKQILERYGNLPEE
jgi:hypothetical protein